MVIRLGILMGLLALFVAACSGGGDKDEPANAIPTSRPQQTAPTPTGPQAVVEPDSGPPGTEVTVRGSGWEPGVLIDVTGELSPGASAAPYETVVSNADGTFSASFRLEKTPDGTDLSTGRYNLIARTAGTQVTIPFQVETRRPVGASGPQG